MSFFQFSWLLSLLSIIETGPRPVSFLAVDVPPLRIVPLGDSITWGMGSTNGDGYREDLLDLFQQNNVQASYIGTQHSGSMPDNDSEGYPLHTIAQIDAALLQDDIFSLPQFLPLPNLILLHAGTNNWPDPSTTVPQYTFLLASLRLLAPDALIMLASIVPSPNATIDDRIADINNQIVTTVIPAATASGSKIFHVDMWPSAGEAGVPGTFTYFHDVLHPNDLGYRNMAEVWWNGTRAAAQQGLIPSIL